MRYYGQEPPKKKIVKVGLRSPGRKPKPPSFYRKTVYRTTAKAVNRWYSGQRTT